MKKSNFIIKLMSILVLSLVLLGCGGTTRTVDRISSDEVRDLSGKWNDTDSKLVAEQMIKDMLMRPWLSDYMLEESKKPVLIVGNIRNKSSEHIDSEIFTKDIERELINSGKVKFVAASKVRKDVIEERYYQQTHASDATAKSLANEIGADFILLGSIKSTTDSIDGKAVIFYQVDLELVNIETNEKVWIGSKEIKKYISQKNLKW